MCYLGDLYTQIARRSLANLWFGPPPCKLNGLERNLFPQRLIVWITELIARTSSVGPTGVITFGNNTHRASRTHSVR